MAETTPPPVMYQSPPSGQMDAGLVQWLEHPYDIMDQLKHTLKGEQLFITEDKSKARIERWEVPKGVKPFLNDNGINYVMSVIGAFVNRSATMSYIDDEEIFKIGRLTCDNISIALAMNNGQYGLDMSLYYTVNSIVVNFVYMTLKRAWKGGERDMIKTNTSIVHTINQAPNQGGRNWFSFPFGGGR